MNKGVCPICEVGLLHEKSEWVDVDHLGKRGRIESIYTECDTCGSELAGSVEARTNKQAMDKCKEQLRGL